MGTIAKEAGVLKLVRPGRRVLRYEVPVTAADVMRRHPRHSVTRPDIFEFPWIVVKPEAVLTPGKVFYIVPNRTIYQLLKARENSDSDQSSPAALQLQQKEEYPKDHQADHEEQVSKKSSPSVKSDAGRTPKHQEHRKRLKHQFLNISCATTTTTTTTTTTGGSTVCPTEERDYDKDVRRAILRVSAAPLLLDSLDSKTTTTEKELKEPKELKEVKEPKEAKRKQPSITTKTESKKGKGKATTFIGIASKLGDLKLTTSRQAPPLKPCIRKPDSTRTSCQFIVRFELPDNYVERLTKAANYRMQYPDFKC